MPGTILVVEDDPAMQELVVDLLLEAGYDVQAAEHGSAALFLVGEAMPDLIVLDLSLPIMDGAAFARRIAARGGTTPILVITSAASGAQMAQEFGAAATLLKPFEPEHLLETVQQLLGGVDPSRPFWSTYDSGT